MQFEFGEYLRTMILEVGPAGWLRWTLDYRNMLVHRGRNLTLKHVTAEHSRVLTATGETTPIVRIVRLFPRDPGRSEVEVLRDATRGSLSFVLDEDADLTVERLFESAHALTECASGKLLEIWNARRQSPSEVLQPKEQWPKLDGTVPSGFMGYAPGSAPFQFSHPSASTSAAPIPSWLGTYDTVCRHKTRFDNVHENRSDSWSIGASMRDDHARGIERLLRP